MNFGEMKTRVMTYSGERDSTKAGYAINDCLRMIYNAVKWPFSLIPGTAITLVAGTQYYALPSNFKFPKNFWYRNTTVGEPQYLSAALRELDNVNDGTPQFWRVMKRAAGSGSPVTKAGWYVGFEEIPSAAFVAQYPTMSYEYYHRVADLSNDSDVPQLDEDDHQIIVFGAVNILTSKQGDAGAFQMFFNEWKRGYGDIIQNAIDFYGEGVIVAPGEDITEVSFKNRTDYGMRL